MENITTLGEFLEATADLPLDTPLWIGFVKKGRFTANPLNYLRLHNEGEEKPEKLLCMHHQELFMQGTKCDQF